MAVSEEILWVVTVVLQTVEMEVLAAKEALLMEVLAAKVEVLLQLVTAQHLEIRAETAEMVALGEKEDCLQAAPAALAVEEGMPGMQATAATAVQQTAAIVDWMGAALIRAWEAPEETAAQPTVETVARV
jgi:hypothetical protein